MCWLADCQVDSFAPRLSFFFNAHNDFFEEIAKYRAARKIWGHVMRERFHAKNENSWKLRFHAQTAGCSLTWQQPRNNIVRTARCRPSAAVLGGCQSLHTNSLDEAYALRVGRRGDAGAAHATGDRLRDRSDRRARSAGRLGYFLERLTLDVEEAANDYIRRNRSNGRHDSGHPERGFPQAEIAQDQLHEYQREIERGEQVIVGV